MLRPYAVDRLARPKRRPWTCVSGCTGCTLSVSLINQLPIKKNFTECMLEIIVTFMFEILYLSFALSSRNFLLCIRMTYPLYSFFNLIAYKKIKTK